MLRSHLPVLNLMHMMTDHYEQVSLMFVAFYYILSSFIHKVLCRILASMKVLLHDFKDLTIFTR